MTETLHNPNPSDLAYVPFVSVDNMMRNVRTIGAETFMRGIAEYIEQDFRRWESFDKKPRIPAHAPGWQFHAHHFRLSGRPTSGTLT